MNERLERMLAEEYADEDEEEEEEGEGSNDDESDGNDDGRYEDDEEEEWVDDEDDDGSGTGAAKGWHPLLLLIQRLQAHPLRHPPHTGNHHLFDRDFDLFLGRKGKGGEAADLEGAAKEFATSGNIDREWQG
jgi:cobalamin biosynthesis protein CobT